VALSGDATEGADLLELGREADLFVLEAAVPAHFNVPGHLDPARAARVASACRARHLLLTHFYPAVLEQPIAALAQQGFEGRLTLAQDGMVVPLTR
jgi:ribonuclease BN (tRNA processing enzyme)